MSQEVHEQKHLNEEKIEINILKYFWQSSPFSTNKKNSIHQFLRKVQIFQQLSDLELYTFTKYLHIRSYEPGEVIFKEGDNGFGFYLIFAGGVQILTRDNSGKESLVIELEKCAMLGELSLLEESARRSATAVSNSNTTLLALYLPDFQELLVSKPLIGTKILKAMSKILAKRFLAVTADIKILKEKVKRYEDSIEN